MHTISPHIARWTNAIAIPDLFDCPRRLYLNKDLIRYFFSWQEDQIKNINVMLKTCISQLKCCCSKKTHVIC